MSSLSAEEIHTANPKIESLQMKIRDLAALDLTCGVKTDCVVLPERDICQSPNSTVVSKKNNKFNIVQRLDQELGEVVGKERATIKEKTGREPRCLAVIYKYPIADCMSGTCSAARE